MACSMYPVSLLIEGLCLLVDRRRMVVAHRPHCIEHRASGKPKAQTAQRAKATAQAASQATS